ncbi:MAG: hypothetical protein ACFB20_10955 [Opitutales bacterium]
MPTKEPVATPVKEYHIRGPESTRSHGPYTVEDLRAMGEQGQVEDDTLYWNTQKEAWVALLDDSPLFSQVFPGRSKLHLSDPNAEEKPLLNRDDEEGEELTVNDMLATANAETDETRHLARRERNRQLSVKIVPWGLGAGMGLSGAALVASQWELFREVIETKEYSLLASEPFLFVGVLDLIVGLLCALGVCALYPVLRLRLALGIGYFGYIFWSWQMPWAAGGVTLASLGLFAMTLSANLWMTILSVTLAVGGMAVFLVKNAP